MILLRRRYASTTPNTSPELVYLLRFFSTSSVQPLPCPPNNLTKPQRLSPDALKHSLSLVKCCFQRPHFLQLHAHLLRSNLFLHHDISLSFFSAASELLSSRGMIHYVHRLFLQFRRPKLAHYNLMIRSFSISGFPDPWVFVFAEMQRKGVVLSSDTLLFSAKCCVKVRSLIGGIQVHGRVLVTGFRFDGILMTALMEMYSVCERCDAAAKVFDEIPKRDVVAWNVLISCFICNSRTRDALVLFNAMQSFDGQCEPDKVTCLLSLQACANLSALDSGKTIHSFINERGYGAATNISNALISMYSKCGCLDEAFDIFKKMPNRNVVSWSTIMYGLAINGYGLKKEEEKNVSGFLQIVPRSVSPPSLFTAQLPASLRIIVWCIREEVFKNPNDSRHLIDRSLNLRI